MRLPVAFRGGSAARVAAALSTAFALGCDADDAARADAPSLADYAMPSPEPIGVVRGVPVDRAEFRLVARDVRYDVDGTSARVALLETTLDARGPRSGDVFQLTAERWVDGRRQWRVAAPELRIRDLRVMGASRSATVLPAAFVVDFADRPRLRGRIAGSAATDRSGVVRASADLTFAGSTIFATGALRPDDSWRADVRFRRLLLADLHPFAPAVPAHGVASGTLALAGAEGSFAARTSGVLLATDRSSVALSGAARRDASTWTLDDVVVQLDSVHPDDWRAWFGSAPPVGGVLRGRLAADGGGGAGIDVDGWIEAADTSGARVTASVDGTVWLEPAPRVDVALDADAVRLADSGPLDVELQLRGDADSLAIVGVTRLSRADPGASHPLLAELPPELARRLDGAALRVDAALTRDGDSRRATGRAELVDTAGRTWLVVSGSAPLARVGALDVELVADSVPLAMIPTPAAIEDLHGYARVGVRASGTIDAPAVEADAELVDARFAVPEYGTGVDSLRTHVRLIGSRVELVDVRAFRAGGALALTGGIRLGGPLDLRNPRAAFEGATVDIAATLDTMTVADMDSLRAVVAGDLRVSGALSRPHIAGTLAVVDGFAYEGKLAPNDPLDPADPPYAELLATAPWPAGRLRESAVAALTEESRQPSSPAVTADVTATVEPDFRVIDEDSDLGARGTVRIVADARGVFALGDARIVDGFYAYYGELFQLAGGAFAVEETTTRLAMSGELRSADRPLGLGQGGHDGLDRRDPPIGIFGYSTPATVLELLRRRTPLPATQAELASLLLFDVPLQSVDAFEHELLWRGDEADDLIGHRSAIQGAGLAWSYIADELYDYVPLSAGYLRAGTIRIGSNYPGWIMLGTQLDAGVHLGAGLTVRATHVVGGETWPGVGLRLALREHSLQPADRHIEVFNEPRFATGLGTAGSGSDFTVRRRTGARVRWLWDY